MTVEENNERFLRLLSLYLNTMERSITPEAVKAVEESGVDRARAFAVLLAEMLDVDTYGKDRKFFEDYFLPSVKMLDVNEYYADEYYRLVKFNGEKSGKSELKYMTCAPYEPFVRDDFLYMKDGRVIAQIGFFDTEYRYPAVLTGGREWMTLLPNEINSQKMYIERAHGKICTYGLGLGYYVLMVALKQNVEKVDVVDIDENVIKLFKENILPKFPSVAREKINVIRADAFEFAKNLKGGEYDYIYVDIWHDAGDGAEMYSKFKELEKHCPGAEFGYWIEDTIKYYL